MGSSGRSISTASAAGMSRSSDRSRSRIALSRVRAWTCASATRPSTTQPSAARSRRRADGLLGAHIHRQRAAPAPLRARLVRATLPDAKVVCSRPLASFRGSLTVDGEHVSIDGWIGSQNHNWGMRHTDRYAWGQVAGFDEDPTAFLECSTARLKLGPVWTPRLSLVVLRLGDRELALTASARRFVRAAPTTASRGRSRRCTRARACALRSRRRRRRSSALRTRIPPAA